MMDKPIKVKDYEPVEKKVEFRENKNDDRILGSFRVSCQAFKSERQRIEVSNRFSILCIKLVSHY